MKKTIVAAIAIITIFVSIVSVPIAQAGQDADRPFPVFLSFTNSLTWTSPYGRLMMKHLIMDPQQTNNTTLTAVYSPTNSPKLAVRLIDEDTHGGSNTTAVAREHSILPGDIITFTSTQTTGTIFVLLDATGPQN